MEPLCHLQATPYGGRGLFSTQHIPTGTLVHTCEAPYATVIYRIFRKEVCGYCFAYAFDAGKNAWNVKYDALPGNGVWFCREDCRDAWNQHQNVHGILAQLNIIVDKTSKRMKEPKVMGILAELRPEDITLETLDAAWRAAETWPVKPCSDFEYLDHLELDTARFLISAIIQLHYEDVGSSPSASSLKTSPSNWPALLELQNNELSHTRSRPDVLASHLRIYKYLRRIMVPALYRYVETSEMVRAILSRDQGNVFGLWDMSTKGDSEMLGWSMYISASFFNHGSFLAEFSQSPLSSLVLECDVPWGKYPETNSIPSFYP